MFAQRNTWMILFTACLAALSVTTVRADEAPSGKVNGAGTLELAFAPADEKPADEKQDEKKDDEKKEDEKKPDPFAVPEGGVPVLLDFIQSVLKFQPTSREEFIAYRQKGLPAMKEAAEKIKKLATDEDKKLPGFDEVDGLLLYFRSQEARDATPEERRQLVTDLKNYFANTPAPSKYGIAAAQSLATVMEYSKNPEEAIPVYQELGAALAASSDPMAAQAGQKMEGAARRIDLIGKPLEISGTEFDGKPFDWNSLRGKVVLVDFWATWCGPCRAELPNVKENYEKYHDKGFEVVGISLDDDREALEKFLAEEQNPWITLHDGGWSDNKVATYYGIMGIPTVILVDKEGKVVSTRARGPELGKQLAELLGPVEDKPAEASEDADAKKSGAEKSDADKPKAAAGKSE